MFSLNLSVIFTLNNKQLLYCNLYTIIDRYTQPVLQYTVRIWQTTNLAYANDVDTLSTACSV